MEWNISHRINRRALGTLMLTMGAALVSRGAHALSAPTERPILMVTGLVSNNNDGRAAWFDRPMLEALGQDGFQTTCPWYNGLVRFDGVRMSRLMQAVGASGTVVTAIALNDYSTDIPIGDFDKYGVLLALKRDGAYMPVSDKGPLFIVYPYDNAPELKAQQFYTRSAWQVAKLIVK